MMEEFPFTAEEWERVRQAGERGLNATLQDDDVLSASCFCDLQDVLTELREIYGNHPILIETEADFTDDPHVQQRLYEEALSIAEHERLPTYTIRLSLAGTLIERFQAADLARDQLLACRSEVEHLGDEYELQQWQELMAKCQSAI